MAKTETAAGELIVPSAGIDIEKISRLGARAAGVEIVTIKAPENMPGVPSEIPASVVHGERPALESVADLFEKWRERPARKKGTAKTTTLRSFHALTNRHKTDDSAIFAEMDWRKPGFTAVIDYHEAMNGGAPDNLGHRIAYSFPLSEEWTAWAKMDGAKMAQADFAAFLEEHIADLTSPTEAEAIQMERDFATKCAAPSELVLLSRGLQVFVGSNVKNAVTLQSGEGQVVWEETHKDAAGNTLKVPGMFMLSIAPFFMGEKIRVPVRLRYRAAGGSLVWFYQIYRPDVAITEQVRRDLADTEMETGLPVYEGSWEGAA